MTTSTRFITVSVAALGSIGAGLGLSAGPAAAESPNGGMIPLGSNYRSCDFSRLNYVNATGAAHVEATITGSSSTVTADVFLSIGEPNTPYQVRLIQGPRPGSQKCNAGDPGVASAVLNTDGNGVGTLTLHDALRPGATNAWVFIDGPPDVGQIRGEFYTSDNLTSLK
jgi:hypothetical protein